MTIKASECLLLLYSPTIALAYQQSEITHCYLLSLLPNGWIVGGKCREVFSTRIEMVLGSRCCG
jgi:hypothetical protein